MKIPAYLAALRGADALGRHTVTRWAHHRMRRHGVTMIRNVRYGDLPTQRFDVYQPAGLTAPYPAVVYFHGGGFTALSKDSHWWLADEFLRLGMALVLVDYRLAPRHPYPAAFADAAAAWICLVRHGSQWGLDVGRLVIAGESAGANLALGVTLAACDALPGAAAPVFAAGVVPQALVALCGLLQVSDVARLAQGDTPASPTFLSRLYDIAAAYLGDATAKFRPQAALADPIVMLEAGFTPRKPLPPTFVGVGGADPLVADSQRLATHLALRAVPHTLRVYPSARHAFFALNRGPQTPIMWADIAAFLARHMPQNSLVSLAPYSGRVG